MDLSEYKTKDDLKQMQQHELEMELRKVQKALDAFPSVSSVNSSEIQWNSAKQIDPIDLRKAEEKTRLKNYISDIKTEIRDRVLKNNKVTERE